MPNPDFLVTLTDAEKDAIFGHIDAIEAILHFRVNLTPKQRQEKCKMGTKNYGKVKNVHDAAMAVPEAIPAAYPIADFTTRMVLNEDMHLIANRINSLAESVDDTRLLLRSVLMDDKAIFYRLLKIAAKGNLPVDAILEKLLAAHKKKPYAKPVEYTIAPKGKITIENVATGRKLVNTGNSVVMLRPAAGLTVNQREAKLIDPESSVVVPKGWTSIEVLNQSETAEAGIAVRLKQ
jgi:hypothetical protein